MGILILYLIGGICILLPSKAIIVIQAIFNHFEKVNRWRWKEQANPEDMKIRPVFSIVIGATIITIALFVQIIRSN